MRTSKTFFILNVIALAISLPIPDPEQQIYYNIINQNCYNGVCCTKKVKGVGFPLPQQQNQHQQSNQCDSDSDDDSDSEDDD